MDRIDELADALANEATPVSRAPRPLWLASLWFGAVALYLLLALLLAGLRPDWALKLGDLHFLAELATLTAVLAASSYSAALLAYPDLHQQRRPALPLLLAAGLFLVALSLSWLDDSPPAPLPLHSIECSLLIAFFALLPALGLMLALRRFASTHPGLAGGASLLFAFTGGALWLRLFELNDSIPHVLLWHYLPLLAAGLLGVWLGRLLLKW